jgi:hypothetical protein
MLPQGAQICEPQASQHRAQPPEQAQCNPIRIYNSNGAELQGTQQRASNSAGAGASHQQHWPSRSIADSISPEHPTSSGLQRVPGWLWGDSSNCGAGQHSKGSNGCRLIPRLQSGSHTLLAALTVLLALLTQPPGVHGQTCPPQSSISFSPAVISNCTLQYNTQTCFLQYTCATCTGSSLTLGLNIATSCPSLFVVTDCSGFLFCSSRPPPSPPAPPPSPPRPPLPPLPPVGAMEQSGFASSRMEAGGTGEGGHQY